MWSNLHAHKGLLSRVGSERAFNSHSIYVAAKSMLLLKIAQTFNEQASTGMFVRTWFNGDLLPQ